MKLIAPIFFLLGVACAPPTPVDTAPSPIFSESQSALEYTPSVVKLDDAYLSHGLELLPNETVLYYGTDFGGQQGTSIIDLSGNELVRFPAANEHVRMRKLLSGERLLVSSDDNVTSLYALDGTELTSFPYHLKGTVTAVTELDDGEIMTGESDGTAHVWSPDTRDMLVELIGHQGAIEDVARLSDGRYLTASTDTNVRLWGNDGAYRTVLFGRVYTHGRFTELTSGYLLNVAFAGGNTVEVGTWDSLGYKRHDFGGNLRDAKATAAGDVLLATWHDGGEVRDAAGTLRVRFSGHTNIVGFIDELANGTVVTGSFDKTAKVWSPTGALLYSLEGHTDNVFNVSALEDGRLVTLSSDHTAKIWSATGVLEATLSVADHGFDSVTLLSDGRLFSVSRDGARVWAVTP